MIHGLGSLIYRTRLKIVAGELGFKDYGDFAHYPAPRWNYLLKDALAWILILFRFNWLDFKSGFASKILARYAKNPGMIVPERGKQKFADLSRELWRPFQQILLSGDVVGRIVRGKRCPGDNTGDGPVTADHLQGDWLAQSANPPLKLFNKNNECLC